MAPGRGKNMALSLCVEYLPMGGSRWGGMQDDNMGDILAAVRRAPIFSSLPDEDIDRIIAVCARKKLDADEIIFSEGDKGDSLYIVLAGAVTIWKQYRQEGEQLLTVCAAGESFGELAMIDDAPRSGTAVARVPTDLLRLERKEFHRVIRNSVNISLAMMRHLSRFIRERTSDLSEEMKKREQDLEEVSAELETAKEEKESTEKQLRFMITRDRLTSLPNRISFIERLQYLIEKTKDGALGRFYIFSVNIDRFTVINESFGHPAGDQVLAAVGVRLREAVGSRAMLARMGGNEFAALFRGKITPETALREAERIRGALQAPYPSRITGTEEILLTATIGIILGRPGYQAVTDCLREGDMAVHAARETGPGQCRIYDPASCGTGRPYLLESDLRKGLARKELRLQFQPIVRLDRLEIVGFETLVRWRHPVKGLISPGEFIPVAEESGLIHDLGRWVLRRALYRLKKWLSILEGDRSFFLTVNVSAAQLTAPYFIDAVAEIIGESGVPASCLKLELTESILMEDIDTLADILQRIRNIGIRFAIDDFGTGYSSLAYLHRLPIDVLKIDQSFVKRMKDNDQRDLVPVIISIGRNMEMDIVAEGVETPDQIRLLRRHGCGFGQGFLFSRPMYASDVTYRMLSPSSGMRIFSGCDHNSLA